jgi:hypothetical protein
LPGAVVASESTSKQANQDSWRWSQRQRFAAN